MELVNLGGMERGHEGIMEGGREVWKYVAKEGEREKKRE